MGKKDEIIDTTKEHLTCFGLFDTVEKLKDKYRAFAGWRAIMESRGGREGLVFLPDRNCAYGKVRDLERIEKYLKKIVKKLEKWSFDVGQASSKECHFGEYFFDESIEGIASPRASYGYLYIQIGILK